MNGAQALVSALQTGGVEVVFGYPGGAIMPVYDALFGARIRHVLARHEQGAVFAADGWARVTGRPGVCIATSGPGATNLLTGIANAYLDSVPLVAITGQVPTTVMGTDAFQEVDIFAMSMPVVKHSFLVRDPDDVAPCIADALRLAAAGRPGPVLVDVPKDVATATVQRITTRGPDAAAITPPSEAAISCAIDLLSSCKRPVIYAGGGVGIARAWSELRAFVDAIGAPVVTTLRGIGAIPSDHPSWLGMLGMHGTRAANLAVQGCDLLVCVGARFDDRATGRLDAFAAGARVIHMDIDPAEVGKLRRADAALVGDIRVGLRRLSAVRPAIEPWRSHCATLRDRHAFRYDTTGDGVHAPTLLHALGRRSDDATIVTCDVGQHQMWVAQHCGFTRSDRHLSSSGLGAMGFGLPAAIGAAIARPDAAVINVTGDGSFLMNVQELATVMRERLAVKILLLDNARLGLVRQWQTCFFERRYSEVDLSDNPDFVRVAESFGVPAVRLEHRDEIAPTLERLFDRSGPLLVHVPIDPNLDVWPLVPPGAANDQMMEALP